MAETAGKFPDQILNFSGGLETLAAMIFGFVDDEGRRESSLGTENDSIFEGLDFDQEDDAGQGNGNNGEQDKAFWEEKDQLLQTTLRRTSTIEMKIRQATKEALRELELAGAGCSCRRGSADGCRDCLRREISDRLRLAGFNCVICKSKWKSSPDIPRGEHTFLEVVDTDPKKGEIRVIIEFNFRAEFELARANDGYKLLTSRLPDLYVGKAERLKALIKILCAAAKKCMEDKKMHMGPWRKKKYMEAKWFGSCERTSGPIRLTGLPGHLPKPRASMLTFDLVENMTVFHPTAIKVL